MEQLTPCPELASLIEQRREEIQSAWIRSLRGRAGGTFNESSDSEVLSWTGEALAAMVEALMTGEREPLIAHAARVSRRQDRHGPAVNEVVEGLLLMRDAAFEPLLAAESRSRRWQEHPLRKFDAALRVLIARLAMQFAEQMHVSLREERDRTAYLLDATGAAGESLDLSIVMPTVAQSIRRALGHSHCSIYLWDETAERFDLCAVAGHLESPRLIALMEEPLDPQRNTFAADALTAQELSTYRSASQCQFGGVSCRDLGIRAAVVLPIRLGDRLLAFALALDTDPEARFDSHELVLASAIARSVAPAVDNARRHTRTRRLLAESQQLQKAAESLLEMQGLEDLVTIICRGAESLTGAPGSAVFLGEEGAVPELSFRHRAAKALGEDVTLAACAADEQCLVLPLAVRHHNLGGLVLVQGERGFREDQRRLASGFADQVAVAIQHAMLHRQHEQLAALRERERLSHDLHDSVSQSIYGVTMYGEAACRLLEAGELEKTSTVLREMQATALAALQEMRLLVFELRQPVLASEGLAGALEDRLAAVEGRAGLTTDLVTEIRKPLPPRQAEALYGIAKEALNNVLKHADATRVAVRLREVDGDLTLEIRDNGRGFDEDEISQRGGLGLRGMRERATGVGAALAISSVPGGGTSVRVQMPVEAAYESMSSEVTP